MALRDAQMNTKLAAMTVPSPDREDLRNVIECSLKSARTSGNREAENRLLLALLSLGPRDFAADPHPAVARSVASFVRLMAA